MKDYYTILGIERTATDDEVKKAFRKLAQKYHPDKKGGDEARFKEISEAYAVLGDKKKRQQYDTIGSYQAGGNSGFGGFNGAGFDFSQFQEAMRNGGFGGFGQGNVEFDLGDIFGDVFGGGYRSQERRGRDISVDIEIDFKDAVFGTERRMLLTKTSTCTSCNGTGAEKGSSLETCATCNGKGNIHEMRQSFLGSVTSVRPCPTCHSRGKTPKKQCKECRGEGVRKAQEEITVRIPAGIDDGEMIRQPEKGEALSGGRTGDLYIKVHVRSHSTFVRRGNDLHMTLPIKLTDALLGTTTTIQTLDGTIDVKVPAGSAHGEVLRIRNKGVPYTSSERGSLLIRLELAMPQKISRTAKKLIEELKKEGV